MNGDLPDELWPLVCGLYLPGHEIHWIQGLRCGNDIENRPVPGRLLEVTDSGDVTVEVQGEMLRFWNHEPERLAVYARRADGRIGLQLPWRALHVPFDGGGRLFDLGDPEDHRSCPAEPPSGDPLNPMRDTGGFTMSGPDATRQLISDRP